MITIRKIQVEVGNRRGALAAARYALEAAEGPAAYAREGEADAPQWGGTAWLGSEEALGKLGLERGSKVELEQLTAALQGLHATSGQRVRKAGPSPAVDALGNELLDESGKPYTKQVVNSYDLTFSVPKSVSVLWSQADAQLRAELEQAILDAANTSLEHLVRTRPVIAGTEVGHGFAASASLHVVARTADGDPAPAPQLHVHMHLVGVLDRKGSLRTPDGSALYKHSAMREAGALARGVLARRIERMGFRIKARSGRGGRYFELAGVPAGLCDRLSGRTQDVLAWVQGVKRRFGTVVSNRSAARGAAATRSNKARVDKEEAQAWWDGHAEDFEFDVAGMRAAAPPEHDVAAIQEEIRAAVLERLWQEGPTVSVGALQAIAYEHVPLGVEPAEAIAVLKRMKAAGELVMLDNWLVTSGEIRGTEQHVRDVAQKAAGRSRPALAATAIEDGIAVAEASLDGHKLDPEQRQAVELLTSGADWACLTGRPGTGKGPVLEAVAEAHRRQGWKVIACALDNATAVRLGKQVNGEAMSFRRLEYLLRRDKIEIDDKTLILIDEASKAGLREWEVVAEACEEAELRVIPVGDVRQSGAIECPGMLDLMLDDEGIPTAELRVVRRHRDPTDSKKPHAWLARASCAEPDGAEMEEARPGYHDALYAGDAEEAIAVLQEEGALEIHETREKAMVELVEKWHQRRREHRLEARDTVLVVYGTNEDVDRVNALAQEKRLEAGEIGGPSVPAVDRSYRIYAGDVVMLREAGFRPRGRRGDGSRPEQIENGTMGTVVAVDAERKRVTVAFDAPRGGPREVTMDLGELRAAWEEQQARQERGEAPEPVPSLRLSIAGHQFPLQGGTWWYTGSLWGDGRQRLEDVISGDARAKCILDVHVDRESLGWEGTDKDRLARKAKQLSEIRHKLPSLLHEVTPEVEITGPYSDFEAAPALPSQPRPERLRARKEWRDPLRHHRRLLGPDRVAALERQAGALAPAFAELDEEQLEAAAERAEEAFARLDPPAAYESLRIERDKRPLEAQLADARELAAGLEVEADAVRSPLRRRERADLEGAAQARRREAGRHEAELGRLRDRERELRSDGRHLDAWLGSERQALEHGIAAERELAERWQRERGGRGEGPDPVRREAPEREALVEAGRDAQQADVRGLDVG